jgi:hypothetical protein
MMHAVTQAGKTETVMQEEFRRMDRRKSMQITGLSVLIGAAAAVLAWLI